MDSLSIKKKGVCDPDLNVLTLETEIKLQTRALSEEEGDTHEIGEELQPLMEPKNNTQMALVYLHYAKTPLQ